MGLSTPITTLILTTIITLTLTATATTTITQTATIITEIYKAATTQLEDATQTTMEIGGIANHTIKILLRNIGGTPIIFGGNPKYKWCSFITSYKTINNEWTTLLIENYTINTIKITGTNTTINPTNPATLQPGQEAEITLNLPETSPPIQKGTQIIIVFTTNKGAKTQTTGAG